MPDINSYLDNITSSIKQLRQDLNDLQLEERPSIRSGLWANRPPNAGLRVSDRYFATDRNIEYVWDGTRWLSVTLYKQPFISRSNQPFAQAVTVFDTSFVNYATGSGVYITAISAAVDPVSAQSGTNFYTLTAGTIDTSGTATNYTLTGTTDTKTMTGANTWKPLVPTLTPVVLGNTVMMAFLVMTPTAAPGTFFMNATLQYQLIG